MLNNFTHNKKIKVYYGMIIETNINIIVYKCKLYQKLTRDIYTCVDILNTPFENNCLFTINVT